MTEEQENENYRKLAGECTKCKHYKYEIATFTEVCTVCKRYYDDCFEKRETTK